MSDARKPDRKVDSGLPPTVIEIIAQEERQDKNFARISILLAAVFHVFIFAVTWPSFAGSMKDAKTKKSKIYVVKQVKFKQPPPRQDKQIPKPKTKRVPIPDPTPDEPEPIRDKEPDEDLDFVPDDNLILGVPDAPPPPEPDVLRLPLAVMEPSTVSVPDTSSLIAPFTSPECLRASRFVVTPLAAAFFSAADRNRLPHPGADFSAWAFSRPRSFAVSMSSR